MEKCYNCEWSKEIDAENQIIYCECEKCMHGADYSCVNWLPDHLKMVQTPINPMR